VNGLVEVPEEFGNADVGVPFTNPVVYDLELAD